MAMDVFIFGVGCSGTTMTYSLLQGIFSEIYEADYYSTYEPFIWDKKKFNIPYEQAADLFGKTASISVEGIYHHSMTPMFTGKVSRRFYKKNEFFRHFSASHGPHQPHLAKLIRGNGRMSIFRAINPKARFLLVLRNPVDNINCAKHKFSFFGEDFYPSDYPRFCQQVKKESGLVLDEEESNWAQRQAEYCYQMNRAALEFAIQDKHTYIIEYDAFIRDMPAAVNGLCDFLDTPVLGEYTDKLQQPTGPVTASNALSQAEYESIMSYDRLYSDLCEQAGVVRGKDTAAIHAQYDGNCDAIDLDTRHEGLTTNRLRRVIRVQEKRLDSYSNTVAGELPIEVAMHNTRLFPKYKGAEAYRPSGIAQRCDWIAMTDTRSFTDTRKNGVGFLRGDLSVQPRTVFLSMRSYFHALPWFYEEVLPQITNRFIFITGSQDMTIPNQLDARRGPATLAEIELVRKIENDERVIHWFAENRDEDSPKMSTLPVGYVFVDKPSNIVKIPPQRLAIKDRPLRVFCSHRERDGDQWDERRHLTELCQTDFASFATVSVNEIDESEFEQQIRLHPFVLCASGGGLDPSPKAWQSIANGSIPIIKSSTLADAYSQLPVAFVDDWDKDCLSVEKLQVWLQQLAPYYEPGPLRTETLRRLSLDYWWGRILEGKAY